MNNLNSYIQTAVNVEPAPSGVERWARVLFLRDGILLGGADYVVYTSIDAVEAALTAGAIDAPVAEFARSLFGQIGAVLTPTTSSPAIELVVGKYDSVGAETLVTGLDRVLAKYDQFWAVVPDSQDLTEIDDLVTDVISKRQDSDNPRMLAVLAATADADYLTAGLPAEVDAVISATASNKFVPWANLAWATTTAEAVGALLGRTVCWPLDETNPSWKGEIVTQGDNVLELTDAEKSAALANNLNIVGQFFSAEKFVIEGKLVDGRQIGSLLTTDWIVYSVQEAAAAVVQARANAGRAFPVNDLGKALAQQVVAGVLTTAEAAGHIDPGWTAVSQAITDADRAAGLVRVVVNFRATQEGRPGTYTLNVALTE